MVNEWIEKELNSIWLEIDELRIIAYATSSEIREYLDDENEYIIRHKTLNRLGFRKPSEPEPKEILSRDMSKAYLDECYAKLTLAV